MVKISDLNKREREIRQSLSSLERQFKSNKVSKVDYNAMKKKREGELKKISETVSVPLPRKSSSRRLACSTCSSLRIGAILKMALSPRSGADP